LAVFGSEECVRENICSGAGGENEVPPPTTTTVTAVLNNECLTRKYHPTTDFKLCSNSLEGIPPPWLTVSKDVYMHNTYEACCLAVFNKVPCPKEDTCGGEDVEQSTSFGTNDGGEDGTMSEVDVGPSAACGSWHPNSNFSGCSNTPPGTYPVDWDQPGVSAIYLSNSGDACCDAFFKNQPCSQNDVCPPSSKECSELKYHPDTAMQKCTNSKDFPKSWEGNANYMHDNAEDCCVAIFSNTRCPKEDICTGVGGTPPAPTPLEEPETTKPTKPTLNEESTDDTSCESALWHPSTEFGTCSNSLKFNELWAKPPINAIYMHEVFSDCCNQFFKKPDCNKEDICASANEGGGDDEQASTPMTITDSPTEAPRTPRPTRAWSTPPDDTPDDREPPSPSSTGGCINKWHPNDTFDGCSNSMTYSSEWDLPGQSELYLHATHDDCCTSFFGYSDCVKEDVCGDEVAGSSPNSSPPDDPSRPGCGSAWHPNQTFDKCSNSDDVPSSWIGDEMFMHATLEDCCLASFGDVRCPREDVCPNGLKTGSPTPAPYARESRTPRPTRHVTERPTGPVPTQSPTLCDPVDSADNKWHTKGSNSGICSNDLEYPFSWDDPAITNNFLFDTPEECCSKFFGSVACNVVYECPLSNAGPSATDSDSCGGDWHPISVFDTRCSNGLADYPQIWISDTTLREKFFFESAADCCSAFYGKDHCVVDDNCLPNTPTSGCSVNKYHPVSAVDRTCTNSDHYPPLWNSMGETFFFKTGEECCDAFYDGDCEIVELEECS
jgi:hypothetical protein